MQISIVDLTVIVAVAICTVACVWTLRKIAKQQPDNPQKPKDEKQERLEEDLEKVFK